MSKAKDLTKLIESSEVIKIELIGPYNEYSPAQEKAMELKSKGETIRHIRKMRDKWFIEIVKRS